MLKFIDQHTGELLILSIFIGFFIPVLGIFKSMVSWILMFLLFSSFLRLELNFGKFFRKELLVFPVLNWLIFPLVIFMISQSLAPDYQLGLLLIIITPPALGAPIIVRLTQGDLEFVIANVVLFNIISPITYALYPKILFHQDKMIIPSMSIFTQVAITIFIPLLLALILRPVVRIRSFVLNHLDPFKGLLQLFMIAVVVSSSSGKIKEIPYRESLIIFGITLIVSFITYLTGYVICRKNKKMQYSCPVSAGHKNTMLAIVTGISNFNPVVAIPSIFYLLSHHIWNGILIYLSKRNNT